MYRTSGTWSKRSFSQMPRQETVASLHLLSPFSYSSLVCHVKARSHGRGRYHSQPFLLQEPGRLVRQRREGRSGGKHGGFIAASLAGLACAVVQRHAIDRLRGGGLHGPTLRLFAWAMKEIATLAERSPRAQSFVWFRQEWYAYYTRMIRWRACYCSS